MALDPARNIVVEACAGSGKTWLLISRILRLLLAGVAPSEILAITFTRKAAQEMTARLTQWLADLALMSESDARAFLAERGIVPEQMDAALERAPLLFEQYQTSVPAMTVSTFHSWFLQILQSVPLAGGVARDATLIEQTSLALNRAWQRYLNDMQSADAPSRSALLRLFETLGLHCTEKLLFNFVAKRADWWAYTAGHDDPIDYAIQQLKAEFGDVGADEAMREFVEGERADLYAFADLLATEKSEKELTLSAVLIDALNAGDTVRIVQAVRLVLFRKADQEPRKRESTQTRIKRIGIKGDRRLVELHRVLCEKFSNLERALATAELISLNANGITCGVAFLNTYQKVKREQREVDFTDIEWQAAQLFANSENTAYLSYKLDTRYRHVLIDEFQDTNPLQWQALLAWLQNAADADARPGIFLVGDPKQSIYRFRRAESRLFTLATQFLHDHYRAERISLNTSRRCPPALIEVLNRIFASELAYTGFEMHTAHHTERWGRIAVASLIRSAEKGEAQAPAEMRDPLQTPRLENEDQRYASEAEALVARIQEIVGKLVIDDPRGARLARYDDIMVLVRRRAKLEIFEAALRHAAIPYLSGRAGGLLATLECKDLVALLTALNHPLDDLALAQALKSPIFSASDDELAQIAIQSPSTWWEKLAAVAPSADAPGLARAHGMLTRWMALADKLPVHDLLDQIFHEAGIIGRYQAAVTPVLRETVAANLRAFTELALSIDEGRYPSLPRFLRALRNIVNAASQDAPDEGEVSAGINAVSIMTIHGAKGLERPVVMLIDCEGGNKADTGYDVLIDWPPEAARPVHFSLYQRASDKNDPRRAYFENEKIHQQRESMNMLYVAMTRAKQVFMASGCQLKNPTTGWHERMTSALEAFSPAFDYQSGDVPIAAQQARPGENESAQFDSVWTRPQPPSAEAVDPARRYGITLHTLLEALTPPAPSRTREELRLICRSPDDEFEQAWRGAQAILSAGDLQRFFDPRQYQRAHNELSFHVDGEVRRIDRMIEFDDAIWLIDYKATHAATHADTLRAQYATQLALYRRAIEQIFSKPVRTALLLGDATLLEI